MVGGETDLELGILILGWLLAPGQAGWGRVGRRREVDHGARYATQLQKQDKRSVFRI